MIDTPASPETIVVQINKSQLDALYAAIENLILVCKDNKLPVTYVCGVINYQLFQWQAELNAAEQANLAARIQEMMQEKGTGDVH